jgi:hypothetical protein
VLCEGQEIALPETWDDLSYVEVVYDDEFEDQEFDWEVHDSPLGRILYFDEADETTLYVVKFTKQHLLTTIPVAHRTKMVDLAASYALERLATAYIQERQESTGVMDLPRLPKVAEYLKMAKRKAESWNAFVEGHSGSVSAFRTIQREQELLFHR